MKQINLLPKEDQRDLKLQFFAEELMIFSFWVIISLLLFLSLTYIAKAYLSGQVANTEGQISQSKVILKSSDNELLKERVETINKQVNSIRILDSQHYYWSEALLELAKLLSPDISLNLVNMDRVTGEILIEGVAGNRESVLKFWADVHKSEFFKDINFPLANLQNATDDPFSYTFSINAEKIKKP